VIVVDTNVLACLYLPGTHTAAAESLLQDDPEWAAPILWRSEIRNILVGYMRRGDLSFERMVALLREAEGVLSGLRGQQRTARNSGQLVPQGFLGDRSVVACLATQPPSVAEPEVAAQTEVGVCRDCALSCDDVADTLRRHADVFGQPVLRQSKRLEEFFFEHLARRDRAHGTHLHSPSMVVNDLDVGWTFRRPYETDTPLIVDSYAVLAPSIAS
jgi:hypothetical protein